MTAPRRFDVVNGGQPEPPYPADTRSRGWKFELDLERIVDSDTWQVAPPDLRPWLLMLWAMSWRCTPTGALPGDDYLIAARIGMPLTMFQTYRETLLRGWIRHSDGKLYHETITERVVSMLAMRAGEKKRQADYRAKKQRDTPSVTDGHGEVTRDKRVNTTPEPEPVPRTLDALPPDGGRVVGADAPPTPKAAKVHDDCPPCPHDAIVAAYHEELPTCPKVLEWNERRKSYLRGRWRAKWSEKRFGDQAGGIDYFRRYMKHVAKSRFLTGQAPAQPGRKVFVANLEWLLRPENWTKVIEGSFHDPA